MSSTDPPIVLPRGKLPQSLLKEVLASAASLSEEVRLGPAIGEDAAVISVESGCLVAAADPITMTGEWICSSAVVVNANDVAVMGVRPRWFLATVLLPVGTTDADVRRLFAELNTAVADAGVALVGGHSEITGAVRQPVLSGVMLGIGPEAQIVRSSGARPGDVIVQIGAAPIEGATVLAHSDSIPWPSDVSIPSISVVDAALDAARLGATAMHDPTEGGLAAGLNELVDASGLSAMVDRSQILWHPHAVAIVQAAGADPWFTLASGTVLATFEPLTAAAAVDQLRSLGNVAAVIGKIHEGSGVTDLSGVRIPLPERDEVARLQDESPQQQQGHVFPEHVDHYPIREDDP